MPLRSEATFVYRPFDLIGVNQRAARDSRAALCRMHVYIGARQSLIKGLLISWYPLSQYTGTRYIPFFIMPWARSRSLGTQSAHAWVVLERENRFFYPDHSYFPKYVVHFFVAAPHPFVSHRSFLLPPPSPRTAAAAAPGETSSATLALLPSPGPSRTSPRWRS